MARGFIPVGLRSGPDTNNKDVPETPRAMVYDCFAAERG